MVTVPDFEGKAATLIRPQSTLRGGALVSCVSVGEGSCTSSTNLRDFGNKCPQNFLVSADFLLLMSLGKLLCRREYRNTSKMCIV